MDILNDEAFEVEDLRQETDIDEIDTVHDIHDRMHKLVDLGEQGTVSQEMFDLTTDVLLKSSPYNASTLFASMEGVGERSRALLDAIKKLWERIWNAMKRLAASFTEFWNRVMSSTERAKQAAFRLRRRAESMAGKSIKNPKTRIKQESMMLVINDKRVNDGSDIDKGLVELKRQLSIVMGQHSTRLVSVGSELSKKFSADKKNAKSYLESLIKAVDKLDISATANSLGVRAYWDQRFRKGEVESAPPLLGNKSLFVRRTPFYRSENPTILARADAARQLGLVLIHSENVAHSVTEYEMNTIPAAAVVQIGLRMEELLDHIQKFMDSAEKKKIQSLYSELTNKVGDTKRWMESNGISNEDFDHYNAAMRFATTYAKWAERPHDQMVVHAISVCRAIISACNKSLSNHR